MIGFTSLRARLYKPAITIVEAASLFRYGSFPLRRGHRKMVQARDDMSFSAMGQTLLPFIIGAVATIVAAIISATATLVAPVVSAAIEAHKEKSFLF
jgi:hypothetical protein